MKKLSSLLLLLLVVMGTTSCSDKNNLQNYFIDHAEKAGFSSSTIPVSLLTQGDIQLTEKQEEALNAIDRVNLLFYRVDPKKQEEFTTEKNNIKAILQNTKYEELINMGNRGVIKYSGTDDSMDEIIIFGSDKKMGFAVVCISGDNMTMDKFMEIYKLSQQTGSAGLNLSSITNFISAN